MNKSKITELNDKLRKQVGTVIVAPEKPAGMIVMTQGVQALGSKLDAIFEEIRNFDNFEPANDSHKEHDFGFVDADDQTVYWKIDYYSNPACKSGSEDPSDETKCFRVMTIMLAEEY